MLRFLQILVVFSCSRFISLALSYIDHLLTGSQQWDGCVDQDNYDDTEIIIHFQGMPSVVVRYS